MFAAEIYSEELSLAHQRGYPIPNPQNSRVTDPGLGAREVPQPCATIGDVGYIAPYTNNFYRLFNIHLKPGVDGQPGAECLPKGFKPMPMGGVIREVARKPFYASQNVSVQVEDADAGSKGTTGYKVTARGRGACLITPDPVEVYDAVDIDSYKRYARLHMLGWYKHVRDELGHDIKLEDLMLVTGVDLTTSWATAVIEERDTNATLHLKVRHARVDESQLVTEFAWLNQPACTTVTSGPARGSIRMANTAKPAGIDVSGRPAVVPLNAACDQQIFVRHIRATTRQQWNRPGDKYYDSEDSDDEGDLQIIVNDGQRHRFTDCLQPALNYIFENSAANVAIAHYEDLTLLRGAESGLNPALTVEDGIGMLE
ncbi:hypothetical protein PENSPDRAFT_658767 [Peniophora sp. CONT]|nr:hypothetical protein PENSPDRAFT_658767 [Peniophora sp. CONT]